MTAHILLTDPTFDPPPTRDQRRLALADATMTGTQAPYDIGPDLDSPLGQLLYHLFEAMREGKTAVKIDDVLAWVHPTFGEVA